MSIQPSASVASDNSSSNSMCTGQNVKHKSEKQNNVNEIGQKTLINVSDGQPPPISGTKHKLEGQDDLNWDDIGGYMRVKKQKLSEQFHGMAGEKKSAIFQGVTVHVNGWTEPSNDELKRMIHAHGGNYVFNIYGNTKVTHTIATNLPNFKIKTLGDSVVCTPAWIVDSIAAGHQLPTDGYLLYNNQVSQKKLSFSMTVKDNNHIKTKEQLLNNNHFNIGAEKLDQESSTSISAEDSDIKKASSVEDDHSSVMAVELSPTRSRKRKSYNPSKGAEFVNEFFTHSRLHYLSTWSTELKQFTARMVNHIQPKYPKLDPSRSLRGQHQRAIVHIDLDCFFVSVSIRDKPHLKGKPVAVTHAKAHDDETAQSSSSSKGHSPVKHLHDSTSDVASCSYEARKAGVHNGMSVGKAVTLCPNLELLPYDFDGYRQVSQLFYESLLLYSSTVEAVSCDEAYLELTDYAEDFERVEAVVRELRTEVESKTGCTVSAGISHNMLLARLSTRKAKPDGQFYLPLDQAETFLASLSVHDLPGVGYSTTKKLKAMQVEKCGELRALALAKLQKDFGLKNGTMLYEFCRGIDSRELKLTSERKSISVDINYGIRFTDISEAESLIRNLAEELEKRAKEAEVVGGNVTLKMKVRKPDVPHETWKYLGHGLCDNVSRSTLLLQPTQEAQEIGQFAVKLLRQVRVVASDIRGMGLQLSKLVSTVSESTGGASSKDGTNLRTLFQAASTTSAPKTNANSRLDFAPSDPPLPPLTIDQTISSTYVQSTQQTKEATLPGGYSLPSAGASVVKPAPTDESFLIDLPPMSQLDCSVLDALPASLRNQILRSYEKSVKSESTQLNKLIEREQQEALTMLTSTSDSNAPETEPVLPSEQFSDLHTLEAKDTFPCGRESVVDSSQSLPRDSDAESQLVIDNEEEFLKEFRKYIREWIANSREGPTETDALSFTDFLSSFTRTNLEMTQVVLRFFRRLVVQLESKGWATYFNTLLVKVQEVTQQISGGTLNIAELDIGQQLT